MGLCTAECTFAGPPKKGVHSVQEAPRALLKKTTILATLIFMVGVAIYTVQYQLFSNKMLRHPCTTANSKCKEKRPHLTVDVALANAAQSPPDSPVLTDQIKDWLK
jgi:hypothetical protein